MWMLNNIKIIIDIFGCHNIICKILFFNILFINKDIINPFSNSEDGSPKLYFISFY